MVGLKIAHLYPKQMNVYGDMGNIITLQYRLRSRGIDVQYVAVEDIRHLSNLNADIIIGGGGQDSNQDLVQANLTANKQLINRLASDGTVMLMICGMYQLFGHRFIVSDQHVIDGVGVLDIETKAGPDRLTGNVVVDSRYGNLVGFENHSGRTMLGDGVRPLGKVIKGAGNNGQTGDEGAEYNNVFGSYLHGPMLAKNPEFADELIKRALVRKYGNHDALSALDDTVELAAAKVASKRPR